MHVSSQCPSKDTPVRVRLLPLSLSYKPFLLYHLLHIYGGLPGQNGPVSTCLSCEKTKIENEDSELWVHEREWLVRREDSLVRCGMPTISNLDSFWIFELTIRDLGQACTKWFYVTPERRWKVNVIGCNYQTENMTEIEGSCGVKTCNRSHQTLISSKHRTIWPSFGT